MQTDTHESGELLKKQTQQPESITCVRALRTREIDSYVVFREETTCDILHVAGKEASFPGIDIEIHKLGSPI